MHMISKKDMSDAEMDTLTKSCSPRIVITANGEVQTHEEAIVQVKELEKFLTMKVLENTPTVLPLGKLNPLHVVNVKCQTQLRIRDASQDRQPEIHSSLVREDFQRIMGHTNNDCHVSNVRLLEGKIQN